MARRVRRWQLRDRPSEAEETVGGCVYIRISTEGEVGGEREGEQLMCSATRGQQRLLGGSDKSVMQDGQQQQQQQQIAPGPVPPRWRSTSTLFRVTGLNCTGEQVKGEKRSRPSVQPNTTPSLSRNPIRFVRRGALPPGACIRLELIRIRYVRKDG